MIDKKSQPFSGSPSANLDEDDIDVVPGAEPLDDDEAAGSEINMEDETAAILLAQKRRSQRITWGTAALLAVVLLGAGYARFGDALFPPPTPKDVAATTAIPVPTAARKSYFSANEKPADSSASTDTSSDTASTAPVSPQTPDASQGGSSATEAQVTAATPSNPQLAPAPGPAPSATTAPTAQPGPATAAAPVPGSISPSQAAPQGTPNQPASAAAGTATASVPPPATPAGTAPSTDGDANLNTLKDEVGKLTSAHEAEEAELKTLQDSLAGMQQKLAAMTTVKPVTPESVTPAPDSVPHVRAARPRVAGGSSWTLRSATSDMALIGHPGADDLKKIVPGDVVSGLGKITSIGEQNGSWVVHGTAGSIRQ